jgi:ethanolamine utilization microcompartment shell protein EutS
MIKSITFHGRKEFQAEYYAREVKNTTYKGLYDSGYFKGHFSEFEYELVGDNTIRINDGLMIASGRMAVLEKETFQSVVIPLPATPTKGYIIAKVTSYVTSGENFEITYKLGDNVNFPALTQQDLYNIDFEDVATFEYAMYSFTINSEGITNIQKIMKPVPNMQIQVGQLASETLNEFMVSNGLFFKKNAAGDYTITSNDSQGTLTELVLKASSITIGTLKFDRDNVISVEEGQMSWNEEEDTIEIGLINGVTHQIGQETYYLIENNTGSTIARGTVIGFTGASGNTLRGGLFLANASADPKTIMGLAAENIVNGGIGLVTFFGKLRGFNTQQYGSVGTILYASATTPGAMTSTEPEAPNRKIPVAAIMVSSTDNGRVFVRPTIYPTMGQIHDVHNPSPLNGQSIVYNNSTNRYEGKVLSSSDVGAISTSHPANNVTNTLLTNWNTSYTHSQITNGSNPHNVTFANITTKPTTLAGYGITDAQPLDADLTAIAVLSGTNGFLKKTATNTWSLDTSTYLTTETDPVFGASNAASITGTMITNWNTAFGWGNHATQGYLKTISVGLSVPTGFTVSNSPVNTGGTLGVTFTSGYSLPLNSTQTNWNTAYTHSQITNGNNPHNTTFANIASKPTTLSGYGITDAAPLYTAQVLVTTSRDLTLSDAAKMLKCLSASAIEINIPLNSSIPFALETEIVIIRYGTGAVTITATSGVTLYSAESKVSIDKQYQAVTLKQMATNEWVLIGALV